MSGLLGCGDLYFNRKIGGVDQGWKALGNATKFEIKTNSTLKERKSKSCGTYGQVVDSVSIKQPDDLSITLDELNRQNLAIAFLGDSSIETITGATITGEAHTYQDGSYIQTAFGNISAVTVKDSGGGALVAGTDYSIKNDKIGFIEILVGGAVNAGDALTVDYTYGNTTQTKVRGGVQSNVTMAIKLVGKNMVDDTPIEVNVWEAVLSPQSGVDFLSEDFSDIQLNGRINLDSGKGDGFEVLTNKVFS